MKTYRILTGIGLAACLLAACNDSMPLPTAAASAAAPAANAPAEPPPVPKPKRPEPPRNAEGLVPACAAYIERTEACYRKLPKAEAAPYRQNIDETKTALKTADTASCEAMNRDFNQTAHMLKCE